MSNIADKADRKIKYFVYGSLILACLIVLFAYLIFNLPVRSIPLLMVITFYLIVWFGKKFNFLKFHILNIKDIKLNFNENDIRNLKAADQGFKLDQRNFKVTISDSDIEKIKALDPTITEEEIKDAFNKKFAEEMLKKIRNNE